MANPLMELAAIQARAVNVYDVPKTVVQGDNAITSIGLVELTAHEELEAAKRAHGDSSRLAFELCKQSLVEVNGTKVGLADGSADSVWDRMSPQVRNLIMSAYAELHAPPPGAAEDFLRTRKVTMR